MQQLHRDQHPFAGLGVIEQHNRLQIVAERDAPPVEINNFRHRPVGIRRKLEPNPRPGQIVAVQRLGNFDPAAIPDRLHRRVRFGRNRLPAGIVEFWRFPMRHIAGMKFPVTSGKLVQRGQLFNRALSGGR